MSILNTNITDIDKSCLINKRFDCWECIGYNYDKNMYEFKEIICPYNITPTDPKTLKEVFGVDHIWVDSGPITPYIRNYHGIHVHTNYCEINYARSFKNLNLHCNIFHINNQKLQKKVRNTHIFCNVFGYGEKFSNWNWSKFNLMGNKITCKTFKYQEPHNSNKNHDYIKSNILEYLLQNIEHIQKNDIETIVFGCIHDRYVIATKSDVLDPADVNNYVIFMKDYPYNPDKPNFYNYKINDVTPLGSIGLYYIFYVHLFDDSIPYSSANCLKY